MQHEARIICRHVQGSTRAVVRRWIASRVARGAAGVVLAVALIASTRAAAAPAERQDDKAAAAIARRAIPLTEQSRRDLTRWVLAHPDVTEQARGHRLVGIRITAASTPERSREPDTIVTVVLFDHTALEARRVVVDIGSGRVVANEPLPGRPQSSREEFEEAVEIIRRDADLAVLLDAGGILDGGFIVNDPAGSRRRMIQLKLLSSDRHTLLRSITVDLTRQEIAR